MNTVHSALVVGGDGDPRLGLATLPIDADDR
jgi:hypothetical protein